LWQTLRSSWDRFVFTPADPTALGVLRFGTGLLAFWSLFIYGLDLQSYLGTTSWSNPSAIRKIMQGSPLWSFWPLVPDQWLRVVWFACLLILGAFTVGFRSRTTAILSWVIVVSTLRQTPVSIYGFDQLVSTLLLYLAVTGASGQAVSLDRYLARLKRNKAEVARRSPDGLWKAPSGLPSPTIAANIALRLIQCHLSVVYGMAGLAKFQGRSWWTGDAFWGTVAAGEFRLFDLTWLATYPLLINLLTHMGLALEVCYPVFIWNRSIRPLLLAAAVAMHTGISLTLGLFEFSLIMIVANFAFVPGDWLRSLVAGKKPRSPAGKVLYDGVCPICRASMAAITAGDPDRVIEPVDLNAVDLKQIHPSLDRDECIKAMHLVHANGKVEVGYDAVMSILGWSPMFAIGSLFRYIPGLSPIGRRIYNKIASMRPRDVVCNDEVCSIHHSSKPPASRSD
jgi:predicted DCC family thiol-disulfide oxidoreductase YuxK